MMERGWRVAIGAIVGMGWMSATGCQGDDSSSGASVFATPDAAPSSAPATTAGFDAGGDAGAFVSGHCVGVSARSLPSSCDPSAGSARGEAFVAILPVVGDSSFVDTGTVNTPEGNTVTELSQSIPGVVSTGVVAVSASSSSTGAQASASIGGFTLSVLGVVLHATTISSTVTSACGHVSGSATVTGLEIGGVPAVVTGLPNQVISVPGALSITLNEQTPSGGAGLRVVAIRVQAVSGSAVALDVMLATASAEGAATCGCAIAPSEPDASTPVSSADAGSSASRACDSAHACPVGLVCVPD